MINPQYEWKLIKKFVKIFTLTTILLYDKSNSMNEHSFNKNIYNKDFQLKSRQIQTNIKNNLLVTQRRDQIFDVASKIFIEKGYHQTTVRDICDNLGLAPGTIYNYVKKKEDILYLIYDKVTITLSELLINTIKEFDDPFQQLEALLERTIQAVLQYQDLILLIYQETPALDKESMYHVLKREGEYVELVENILDLAMKKEAIKNKNIRLCADIIVFLLAFIPLRRWNLRSKFSEPEIKSGLIDFIIRGLEIKKVKK